MKLYAQQKSKKPVLPFLLLGAVLTGLTIVFPSLGFLEWLTMIPLFVGVYRLADEERSLKTAYGYGFLTIMAFYMVIYHWFIRLYPLDFVGMDRLSSAVVIVAGWVGLSVLQAIAGGFVFLLFRLLHRIEAVKRSPVLRILLFSALWVIFEWSSTLTWTGVPWGRLCLGQADYLPMLQSASLFGSYFVSFLILIVNAILAYAVLYLRPDLKKAVCCIAVALVIVTANFGVGLAMMHLSDKSDDTVRVAVVQGNVNSHDKWSSESYNISKRVYGEMTQRAADAGAEIVIWPETAFPYVLNRHLGLKDFVSELAQDCGVTIIVGALYTDEHEKDYNALYMVTPDGDISENVYAKRHLVPFGEYVPLSDLIEVLVPPLAELSALGSDLTAGEGSALFETEWGALGSLICFDSIYESLALESVRDGAELLILSSNDSWFYDSAAIYQHEAQARLRAIETGRCLARAGNTGISSIVSETGKHLDYLEPLTRGYAISNVEMRSEHTLYTMIGNTFVYVLGVFVLALPITTLIRKRLLR